MIKEKIKPQLKTFDLTMIVVGLVIGMGIFRNPVEVANKAGIPVIFFLAWITGAVISFIGALTFAEIGSRYPVAGGFYKIFSHCYHPSFAFMVNWIIVISNAGATALVAIMGAEYIAPILLPDTAHDTALLIITFSSIIFLYIINMIGIKVSAGLLNGLMLIKISMLLLLISAVFFVSREHSQDVILNADQHLDTLTTVDYFKAFALCFIPVFFTYGGYQQTMNFGNDIPNARHTMPRAIFFGISIILILYLSVNYSYYKVLGFSGLQHTTTLAADMTGMMFGNIAYKLVSIIMFFSVMAYVNVSVMSNPRIYFAMAEDKVLPPIFMRLNHRTQIQEFSLTLFCIFILLTLFFISSFKQLLEYVMFFDSISLIAAASAIFILRYRAKKHGEPKDIFKIKGYPYLPILYVLVYTVVNISVMVANPMAAKWGFLLFISGFPLYHLIKYLLNEKK
jgi:APA family basic amino acid/polyamine antiporter